MIRCQQCRAKDVELLTHWERLKNALFYKLNEVFFADDFEDLKSQKYTQGYSDGNTDGFSQAQYKYKPNNADELYGHD
jgi:hypothetical protein